MLTLSSLKNTKKVLKGLIDRKGKLLCLSAFCFLNFSCGKNIENTTPTQEVRRPSLDTSFFELTASFNGSDKQTQLNSSPDNSSLITVSADAFIRIPEYLSVTSGNAGNHFARIHFRLPGFYEFYCSYVGGADSSSPSTPEDIENGLLYHLENCYEDVDQDGEVDELGYYPGYQAAIDQGAQIELEILGADPNATTTVLVKVEVDWY